MIENAFPCPHCGTRVLYSPRTNEAQCPIHGRLLYTDIPPAVSFKYLHKGRWKTVNEVVKEHISKFKALFIRK